MKTNCSVCKAAPAVLHCSQDSAFLCGACDGQVHGTSAAAASHARSKLCDLCDSAPATVFCKNDDAHLCASCDTQIHQSNALAARHERISLQPLVYPETEHKTCCDDAQAAPKLKHSASSGSLSSLENAVVPCQDGDSPSLAPAASDSCSRLQLSTLTQPVKPFKDFDAFDLEGTLFDIGNGLDLGCFDMDFLGGGDPAADGVVPICFDEEAGDDSSSGMSDSCELITTFDTAANTYTSAPLLSQPAGPIKAVNPVTSCSPASSRSDWSAGFVLASQPLSVSAEPPLSREARVNRYREKRARRTFQKTIRYQSRKAYAEIRPRIKGRFATREEVAALKAEQAQ